MEDVRTRRGADIPSDYQLPGGCQDETVTEEAMDNWRNRITKIALNKRFPALQNLLKEEETTMEDNWEGIKEALTSTCQEVLGLKKHHHKEWISIETLDRIKEKEDKTAIDISQTRAEKVQGQAEFIDANKQVKKSIKADKQKHIKELATTEEAAREGNVKQRRN
ncbi:unnamed protein product [Schistosoma mattheei]|uniref:Uncharacterized protein n=1 Tax=Schistosoma mattheei TaxID=31246 RepID=A0A183NHS9_9TREM|nr:unnamed protein product [Schistosoma mattheei]